MRYLSKIDQIYGCFWGVMIGDAMGMPWETMLRIEILLKTFRQGISGFSYPVQTKIKDTMHLSAGAPTDDWRGTKAGIISLINCRGKFKLGEYIKCLLAEFDESPKSFSKNTRENLLQLKQRLAKAKSYEALIDCLPLPEELFGQGLGNGLAVKVSPIALMFGHDPDLMFSIISSISRLTHKDPQARLSAHALATAIYRLYCQPITKHDKDGVAQRLSNLIEELISETALRQNDLLGGKSTDFSRNLRRVAKMQENGSINDLDKVILEIGTGFHCAESVCFALASYLRHPFDFAPAIIETINSGGDTDSNASMVGALSGVNNGSYTIPSDWRLKRYRLEMESLATDFYDLQSSRQN